MSPEPELPYTRAEGVTDAERYLEKLCTRSFLTLWSYPGIYRDQQTGKKGDGKEVCDLMVVLENEIVIFSDKACAFKDTGNVVVDWSRWSRKSILKSAEQVFGAERWLKTYPERLYLDRACTRRFPIPIANTKSLRVHRVVVAHHVSARCQKELGGSGSLAFDASITGSAHESTPFTVGQIDPTRGFVHVLDDVSLEALLGTLDTITDFLAYLGKKEAAVLDGRLRWAAGEEEILAHYLRNLTSNGKHDFVIPAGENGLKLSAGEWANFARHPRRLAQISENEISYTWDALIEQFTQHVLAGTQYRTTHRAISDNEKGLRFMARESRTQRRILSQAVYGLFRKPVPPGSYFTRVVSPSKPGGPYYVLLVLSRHEGVSDENYRLGREKVLEGICWVTKLKFPDARDIIGIATDPWPGETRSEDFLYLDAKQWGEAEQKEAKRIQNEMRFLTNTTKLKATVKEYPLADAYSSEFHRIVGRNPRNKLCPCGSGQKYKKCCLDMKGKSAGWYE